MDEELTGPTHEPRVRRARRRATAWRAFAAGEFAKALQTFSWLNEHDQLDAHELRALVELYRDAGDAAAAARAVSRALGRSSDGGIDRAAWFREAFELLDAPDVPVAARARETLPLLQLAGALDDPGIWHALNEPERLEALEERFPDPLERLEALEALTFAPAASGLAERASARIEAIGHLAVADPAVSRAAERLLHDLGRTDAAYGIERARREARRLAPAPAATALPAARPFAGMTVVIAGGHPALRALIARDLARDGVEAVRELPSAQEAVRSGRDVDAMLAGADAAVLLIRQLAHSTGDQVKTAARKAGVTVLIAESAGTGGVRRALLRHLERDRLDSPGSAS